MKKIILSLILIMGITSINAQNLNTEMEKVSYSLGVNVAKSVKNQGLTSIDSEAIAQAFTDVFEGNELNISEQESNLILQDYFGKLAKEAGYDVKVGKFPFSASGKASAAGHKDGFVKVIFDAKYGEWLGCHMIGYNVTEMIAEAVVARKLETTGHEILKAVHPHPTMSEAVMEAVAAAYDEVIHM